MTENYAGNPSISPHIASYNQLFSIIDAMDYCPEILEAFCHDPIISQHNSFRSSVCAFLLNATEKYIQETGIPFLEIADIYSSLHQGTYDSYSSQVIQRLDLEELTKGNRTVTPDREFYEFFQRNPHLHQYEANLRKNIFSFLNEMTNLAYPETCNCTDNFNTCNQQNDAIYTPVIATSDDGNTYDGFAVTNSNGEITQIFPKIDGCLEVIEGPSGP